ncbi:LemA family protein [Pseudonocardia eucalypti]|uniref:LemA family protein n=1 Tax=Pseudonocardia eucalypti TaxID=648755 RepID=A0ABP9PLP2_9PSEU|nr:LemA protein [Pseudonocardia eucalypti]
MTGAIILLLLLAVAGYGVICFNRLVTLRNRVDSAWAQIDVQLNRRHDLIPNLVETVKGYAAHERETLERVVAARGAAMSARGSAERARAEDALSNTLKSLFAVTEAYPELKANENFLQLQEELTSTEDRIAYSRQFLNDSVRELNTRIETVPSMWLAGLARATRREYFEVDDARRENVRVQF